MGMKPVFGDTGQSSELSERTPSSIEERETAAEANQRIGELIDMRRFDAARVAAAWWANEARAAFSTSDALEAFETALLLFVAHELEKKSSLMLTSVGGPQQPLRRVAERFAGNLAEHHWPMVTMVVSRTLIETDGPEGPDMVWSPDLMVVG